MKNETKRVALIIIIILSLKAWKPIRTWWFLTGGKTKCWTTQVYNPESFDYSKRDTTLLVCYNSDLSGNSYILHDAGYVKVANSFKFSPFRMNYGIPEREYGRVFFESRDSLVVAGFIPSPYERTRNNSGSNNNTGDVYRAWNLIYLVIFPEPTEFQENKNENDIPELQVNN